MDGCLRLGLSTPGGACGLDEVAATAATVDRQVGLILWYVDFAASPPVRGVAAVAAAGATPVITWEPWFWRTDVDQVDGALLAEIADGRHDDLLTAWAAALAQCGTPVLLRFAHEFNGDWYPWTPARGTPPQTYVAAWRHAHDLFRRVGATNVQWMWSPDAESEPPAPWYPGDDCVDVVGIDGYNWGTTRPWSRWTAPVEIFEPALTAVRALTDRPVILAEVGCAEHGGSKPDWISDLVAWAAAQPDVGAVIWFDHDKETDWRIASTPAAAAAMARALRAVAA
ncbi:glycoside hydrolase family 26 protein [Mycobacterium sp. GA-2829]|uniref:glycoside hydrolase family 26 protein n=1 Tax=Mycobacterium sp. GA-2829 TaxID=1772283 RepID=UPI000740010B|nr:glycosyl hydrolase [Mycobacterium sp. GA-2829]KUI25238.1 endoglucanase [Mycobacterium sp. GA-2829]